MLTVTQVAFLSICGGISGTIEQCSGNPTSTAGSFGDAIFNLTAVSGTINITKGHWEGCVAAARLARISSMLLLRSCCQY